MGVRHETHADLRRAVSSGVGADAGRPATAAELSRDAGEPCFAARSARDSCRRHEDLTTERSRRRDGRHHGRPGAAVADRRAADGARARRASGRSEMVGFARAMRARAVPLPRAGRRRRSTPAARAATARTRSTCRPPRRSSSPAPACASPSTATARSRASAAAPTSSRRSASSLDAPAERVRAGPGRRPVSRSSSRRPGIRRCDTPGRRGGSWACARRSICSVRSPIPPAPRRQLVGVSRPEHTELLARTLGELGVRARLGRARRRRTRRAVHARPYEGLRAPSRRREYVLCAPGGRRAAAGDGRATWRAAPRRRTPR